MGYASRNRGTYEQRKAEAIKRNAEEHAARVKAMDDEMDKRDEERRKMLEAMSPEQRKRYQSKMRAMSQMIWLLAGMRMI